MAIFNSEKASHLTAYLLLKAPDRALPIEKAASLLYLATRSHLYAWGMFLVDEPLVASQDGISGLFTMQHLKASCGHPGCPWDALPFARKDDFISLTGAVDLETLDWLSRADEQTLNHAWSEFGHLSADDLSAYIRRLPEWRVPAGKRYPVGVPAILSALGIEHEKEEIIPYIKQQREIGRRLRSLAED